MRKIELALVGADASRDAAGSLNTKASQQAGQIAKAHPTCKRRSDGRPLSENRYIVVKALVVS